MHATLGREGVSGRAQLRRNWGSKWGRRGATGADGAQVGCKRGARMGLKSYVFAGGKKFEGKRMTERRVFVAILDALRMTPV